MKKNKTLAYALAATLLVGGTFAGTKAWFTDSITTKTDLVIATGEVDLDITEGEWSKNNKKVSEVDFSGVVPGDIFTTSFTVENKSTVDVDLSMKWTESEYGEEDKFITAHQRGFLNYNEIVVIGEEEYNTLYEAIPYLGNGEKATIYLEVKVGAQYYKPSDGTELTQEQVNKIDNDYQGETFDYGKDSQYIINAEQANKVDKPN